MCGVEWWNGVGGGMGDENKHNIQQKFLSTDQKNSATFAKIMIPGKGGGSNFYDRDHDLNPELEHLAAKTDVITKCEGVVQLKIQPRVESS